jgi:uroporphyrinogen III methyltransferase/synthase
MRNNSTDQNIGKVYLVGAGPGDPGLITVKGLRCIAEAGVLVYDRLAGGRLLAHARAGAELIYVGKLPDRHTLPQEEINRLLLEKARQGKIVTRLKGGDPYLFGRGGEEAEILAENGIPFEVVPGITSAIAVPAYAGIPVTHRDFTSSFAVITGHEDPAKNESGIAWDKIATGIGTLVFLMGVGNLPFIVRKLVENGRDPSTPVALIRWGTRPEQRTLTGTLADIVAKVHSAGFHSPAVTIVGEVVGLRDKLQWFENKPFFGKRIVVTRSRAQAGVLSVKIEALGGEPFEFPAIEVVPPADYGPLDRAIGVIESYRWVVFTSVNGVEHFFARLRHCRRDLRDLKGVRLCAIGPRTREALEEKGLLVDYVPDEYRAEAAAELLRGAIEPGDRVLLPRADIARPELAALLSAMGAAVDNVEAYRTRRGGGDAALLRGMLQEGLVHAVTFTSSSTARNFVELLGPDGLNGLLNGVVLASIGPVTSAAARELGLRIDVEAREYTIDGLIAALLEYFQAKGGDGS